MQGRHGRVAAAAGSALALAGALGCADLASTRDVRVTVVDEDTAPLPGAVFYVEAVDDSGAFACEWGVAGPAGEVPVSAREPVKIPWRPGARLAMAAFAPGRTPAVIRETGGAWRISDGAVLELRPGDPWNPELAALAFPFEDEPALAALVAAPSADALREAFRAAWAAAPAELPHEAATKRAILANPGQATGRSGRSLGE